MWNTITCNMIVIEDNETSQYYSTYCKPSWEGVGITVNNFKAVTPSDLYKHRQLKFSKYSSALKYTSKGLKAEITDTEKACWYSHFLLWQECCFINKPMLILEHDTYLEHPEKLWYNTKYGIIFFDKAAMGSYIIQPWFAKQLIDYSFSSVIGNGPYAIIHAMGVDRQLSSSIVNSSHHKFQAASNQVMSSKYGNTIEHYCTSFPHHWSPDQFHKFKVID